MSLHQHPFRFQSRRRLVPVTGALVLALTLVGCGDSSDDDDENAVAPGPTTTTMPAPVAGAGGETIEVRGVDYGFVGIPTSIETGSTITFSNDSDGEVHEIVLFKLPEDEQRRLSALLALPEEEVGMVTGPPVGVSFAFPGEDGMVVEGDLTVEDPGRYVMICAIPTGADPQAYRDALAAPTPPDGPPDVPGGAEHFTQGMVAEFSVS